MHSPTPLQQRPSGRPSLDTTSMVLGIVAVPALLFFALGLPLGLAAAATGVVALTRGERGAGRALAGVALGLLAIAGGVILIARRDT